MEKTSTILGFSVLTGLVNSTNILIIFITLVIVFFLMGIIMGFHINTKKSNSKDEPSSNKVDALGKLRQTEALGQDNQDILDRQINNSYSKQSHSRHKHHSHSSKHLK